MGEIVKLKLKKDEMVMLGVVYFYLYMCPYNKVEESFNTQAIHDIIYNTKYLYYYDHITFPGVVPRTFMGALSVALPTGAISYVTQCSKPVTYLLARAILGLYVVWSFSTFRRAIKKVFGASTACFLLLLTCTQFHFMFYASRTLPNTFAVCASLFAAAHWLNKNWDGFLWWSGLGVLVFRSELAILLGPMLLWDLVFGKKDFKELISPGLQTAAVILIISCCVDTYLWRYTVWPELTVLYYNTWLNKSGDWGTMPALWYFYSALPRAMLFALPLSVVGCLVNRRILTFCVPGIVFVCLYSVLPHKELRFILYAVPLFNVAAAYTLTEAWAKNLFAKLIVVGVLLANIACCAVFLSASYYNYPGGPALTAVHTHASCSQNTTVYIGNYAAQNGASRFGEQCDSLYARKWNYVKTEELPVEKIRHFQLLLVEPKHAAKYTITHIVAEKFYCYNKFKVSASPPFIEIEKKEAIFMMKSKTIKRKIVVKDS